MRPLFLIIFLLTLSACSSTETGIYKKSSEFSNNLKNNIPLPWIEVSSEGSDFALENDQTKSFFLFNSACRKHEASDLDDLTSSILTGIEDLNFIEKKNTFYQGRKAVEVLASGKLDGVLRYFKIITIQKNNCVYDYVLISTSQKNIESDGPALILFSQRIILK